MNDIAENKESRIGFFFLVLLLLVSGVTASIVGYRVKSADIERKRSLQQTYLALGGVPDKPLIASAPVTTEALDDRTVLILVYEMNQHIRGFGLAKMLASVPKDRWSSVEKAFDQVQATEATSILREALTAYQASRAVAATDVNLPAEVRKVTNLYSSKISRYVEASLFKFAVEKNLTARPVGAS